MDVMRNRSAIVKMRGMIALVLISIILFLVSGCGNDTATSQDKENEFILCEVMEDGVKTAKMFPADKGCPEIKQEIEDEKQAEEIEEEPVEEISFDYIVGECDEAIDAYDISGMGIKSIKWISDSQVKIIAYVSMNCAESIKRSDYEIDGSTLYLTYAIEHCKECATCMCAKKITFVIEGITKKKYEYKLVGF